MVYYFHPFNLLQIMKPNFTQKVSNWGNYPVVKKEMCTEENYEDIKKFILNHNEVIARGNGRCYGDASLGEAIFSTKKLNKCISFDRINGILECESGVLLSEILDVIVPQGYFLYVTPGTSLITIGGAIASDVHGKNHHSEGSFTEYVIEFSIMVENREENSDLFWATIGGMGLTGIILSAKFRLKNIETAYIRQEQIKANNLDEIFQLFEESENWTYTVAWIDCLQKGENIGRSIMMRGEHALKSELPLKLQEKALELKKKFTPTIPFYFPNFILNTLSVKIFNWIFFNKQKKEVKNIVDYKTFFYPLDIINDWNKIYGKKGFIQYQMIIPKKHGKEGIKRILETIAKSGPIEGYSVALDFKINSQLKQLVSNLDNIVEEFGGRIYLTKDSMSKPSLTNYLKNTDSTKFVSLQSKRIKNNY